MTVQIDMMSSQSNFFIWGNRSKADIKSLPCQYLYVVWNDWMVKLLNETDFNIVKMVLKTLRRYGIRDFATSEHFPVQPVPYCRNFILPCPER